jgi:hypothetical protein
MRHGDHSAHRTPSIYAERATFVGDLKQSREYCGLARPPGPCPGDRVLRRPSLTAFARAGTLSDVAGSEVEFEAMGDASKMSKPLAVPGLAQFVAATAGRNMTKVAYAAVVLGVGAMVLVTTTDPAFDSAHRSISALLWACQAYFALEWAIRIYHAATSDRRRK